MTGATVARQYKIIDQDTFRSGVGVIHDGEGRSFYDAEQYFAFCYEHNISTTHFKDMGDLVRSTSFLSPQWIQ